jgi:hypothetical protein
VIGPQNVLQLLSLRVVSRRSAALLYLIASQSEVCHYCATCGDYQSRSAETFRVWASATWLAQRLPIYSICFHGRTRTCVRNEELIEAIWLHGGLLCRYSYIVQTYLCHSTALRNGYTVCDAVSDRLKRNTKRMLPATLTTHSDDWSRSCSELRVRESQPCTSTTTLPTHGDPAFESLLS